MCPAGQVCRVLSAVNSRNNPIPSAGKSKNGSRSNTTGNNATTNNNGSTAAKGVGTAGGAGNGKEKINGIAVVDEQEPLKAFHSLFGLSPTEAKELYRRAEGEGEDGAKALKMELDRRKAAYIRVVLTVAPSLGMTHANPGMQGEVRGHLTVCSTLWLKIKTGCDTRIFYPSL